MQNNVMGTFNAKYILSVPISGCFQILECDDVIQPDGGQELDFPIDNIVLCHEISKR